MNLKFVVNDYILIWNLLFQASISESLHKMKQKIWINYKKEYNATFCDNELILKDPKNFIPNDDTIYNIILETKEYEVIKKNTEKYRVKLLKVWDDNKKKAIAELKQILRFDIKLYHVLVVCEKLNVIDTTTPKGAKVNTIVFGKTLDEDKPIETIIRLIYEIVHKEMKNYQDEYKDIVDAVIELAILNEFATRVSDVTHYLTGDNTLKYLKKQIYPYWLMYLGVAEADFQKYMSRDNIIFNTNGYTYERQLRKLDLFGFVDFCIRNQKQIIKINQIEII